jgi:regulator of protease activity HflC (stomatin/prohibitin superfamily)
VINAEGEKQAATMLAEAARTLAQEEQALQLRYLQTLKEIANEKTNTIVFPMPLEFVEPILKIAERMGEKR